MEVVHKFLSLVSFFSICRKLRLRFFISALRHQFLSFVAKNQFRFWLYSIPDVGCGNCRAWNGLLRKLIDLFGHIHVWISWDPRRTLVKYKIYILALQLIRTDRSAPFLRCSWHHRYVSFNNLCWGYSLAHSVYALFITSSFAYSLWISFSRCILGVSEPLICISYISAVHILD